MTGETLGFRFISICARATRRRGDILAATKRVALFPSGNDTTCQNVHSRTQWDVLD